MSEVSPAILSERYRLSDNFLQKLTLKSNPDICKLTNIIHDGYVGLSEFNHIDDNNMSKSTRDMFYKMSEALDQAIIKAHPEFATKLEIPVLNE